jgi:membrane protease YdiL (CAAX protease family)
MIIRGIVIMLSALKALIRSKTKSGPVIDIGDIILVVVLLAIKPPGSNSDFEGMLRLPSAKEFPSICAVGLGLFLLGRAFALAFGMERASKLKMVSAGGAAISLRFLNRRAALLVAIPFCIPGAFLEEMLFRLMLYGALAGSIGRLPALFLQAVAFAAVHSIPAALLKHGRNVVLYASIFPFLSALALQWLVNSGYGLISSVIVHTLLNATAVWRSSLHENEGIP